MEVLAKAIVVILVVVKNLPAMQETGVQSLGQEDPLKKEMATHFRQDFKWKGERGKKEEGISLLENCSAKPDPLR